MPGFTRKAIKESFLKLLNQKSLNQITVKDIVEDCGINRNSFYYHFADIPTLLGEIIAEEAKRIINEYPTIDSIEDALKVAIKFALDNKRAVYHIYNSSNRDMYIQHMMGVCEYVVTTYINTVFPDLEISQDDKNIIIRFYKCECFGQIIDWLNSGMKEDILKSFTRLCELRHGMVEEMISRCAKK
ncbi:MAG: TetR/AcrR family transcriptional regulator [Acutalibacteraceae bacterium]